LQAIYQDKAADEAVGIRLTTAGGCFWKRVLIVKKKTVYTTFIFST